MKKIKVITLSALLGLLSACGGGGSSDSGVLINGSLIEEGGASHASLNLKHSGGEGIENVQVCALSKCSTTDTSGLWGFVVSKPFDGGDITFTIKGHGIDTTTMVEIPTASDEVFIHFQHLEGGIVSAHHVTVDGETLDNEEGEGHHE